MAAKTGSRILITGDSFVEGVGGSNGGWAQLMARSLPDIAFDIHGIGGQTSDDLLTRLARELEWQPTLVIVGIGTNDARWRPSLKDHDVPLRRFQKNIERIANTVSATGARLAFVGLTSVDEHRTSPFKPDKFHRNSDIARYDAALHSIAVKRRAVYINGPDLAAVPRALADGLHPSDIGHGLILQAVKVALAL